MENVKPIVCQTNVFFFNSLLLWYWYRVTLLKLFTKYIIIFLKAHFSHLFIPLSVYPYHCNFIVDYMVLGQTIASLW